MAHLATLVGDRSLDLGNLIGVGARLAWGRGEGGGKGAGEGGGKGAGGGGGRDEGGGGRGGWGWGWGRNSWGGGRGPTRLASTSAALWCSSVSLAAMAPSAAEICVLSLLSRSSAAASRAASIPIPSDPKVRRTRGGRDSRSRAAGPVEGSTERTTRTGL